ncbi:hypothetical protein CEXT_78931 [Caerostris extrusa]|uniref:Uncharacterized protein n=1 Tax=Caerostris extrusa TaxID=172846 RepID=A0AAV4X7I7_CAEEX|nr:hypothetical protein CEXT_78931 [Caerostris extrusa]
MIKKRMAPTRVYCRKKMDFRRTCADVKAKAVDGNYASEILAGNYFDIWRKQNGEPSDIFRVRMKKEERLM